MSRRLLLRNVLEFAAIAAAWAIGREIVRRVEPAAVWPYVAVVGLAWAKTAFFGVENLLQLKRASEENWPYHRFMALMAVNMLQIVLSFALDFSLLDQLDPASFGGVRDGLAGVERVFEFFYYSSLNFMFFGYGDVTPQTLPAKLLTLTEIALAFVTVIFLLSDFIGLKDSLRFRDKTSADG